MPGGIVLKIEKQNKVEVDIHGGVYCYHYQKNIDNPCSMMEEVRNPNSGYSNNYYCNFFEQGLYVEQHCGIKIRKCDDCLKATDEYAVNVCYDFLSDFAGRVARGTCRDYDECIEGINKWKEKKSYKKAVELLREELNGKIANCKKQISKNKDKIEFLKKENNEEENKVLAYEKIMNIAEHGEIDNEKTK